MADKEETSAGLGTQLLLADHILVLLLPLVQVVHLLGADFGFGEVLLLLLVLVVCLSLSHWFY